MTKSRYAVQVVEGDFSEVSDISSNRFPIPTNLEYLIFNTRNRNNENSLLSYVDNSEGFLGNIDGVAKEVIQDRAFTGEFYVPLSADETKKMEFSYDYLKGKGGYKSNSLGQMPGYIRKDSDFLKAFSQEFTIMLVCVAHNRSTSAAAIISVKGIVNENPNASLLVYKAAQKNSPMEEGIKISTHIGGFKNSLVIVNIPPEYMDEPFLLTITFSVSNGTTARINGIEVKNDPQRNVIPFFEEGEEGNLIIGASSHASSYAYELGTLAVFSEDFSKQGNIHLLESIEKGLMEKFDLSKDFYRNITSI